MPVKSKAFDKSWHYTERTVNQRFVEWINRIIEENNLDLGVALQEAGLSDRKSPDIIIQEHPESNKILCLAEIKLPAFDVLSETELIEPAFKKARKVEAPYFVTSNINHLVWFSREKYLKSGNLSDWIIDKYTLSDISDPDEIDQPEIRNQIKGNLKRFLIDLIEISRGKKHVPKKSIDELLILRLQAAIKPLQVQYKSLIRERAIEDTNFNRKLAKWFVEQGWNYASQNQDFEKAARQAGYLLINKILFYTALQEKLGLSPLSIPEDLMDSEILKSTLQAYFNRALKIDYETVFTTDFIDDIAFPESSTAIITIKELVKQIKQYRLAELGSDVIGRIFEGLIPTEERHKYGQYFTHSDVVDFILKFCLQSENDNILDPACGTGTFLVRAYQHKKLINPRLNHEDVLKTIWGCDIAKFPSHLATINLAINDLNSEENYPGVFQKDFFDIHPDLSECTQPKKIISKGLGDKSVELELPEEFDCVVGNPPYTRHEELESMVETEGYKNKITITATHYRNKKIAHLSKRAGIYAHFLFHGWKFLKKGGHFGFIVTSSWLDVDYGKSIQEFFLRNYKIIAIIESKVERWFPDADVNTCIIILNKCSGENNKNNRNENIIRFVYLKKPLRHFIPPTQNIWEKQIERLNEIEKLKKTIFAHRDYYENNELRIFPKNQKDLWEEGYDLKEKKYIGAKWGKYLRAPEVFFKILEKSKRKFIPLKEVAKIRSGIKSGANEFFYLTEEELKQRGIEEQFWMHQEKKDTQTPNYIAVSPSNIVCYKVNSKELKKRVLLIRLPKEKLRNKKILNHILLGERKDLRNRKTCRQNGQRKEGRWYDLDDVSANLMWPEYTRERLAVFYSKNSIFINNRLYGIHTRNPLVIGGLVNSTIFNLFAELSGPQPGGGGGPKGIRVYDLKSMLLPYYNIKKFGPKIRKAFEELLKRKVHSIFSEIGTSSPDEFSIDKVMPDRRKLDKIIMGEMLGLTKEEQIEVYKAVVDLVKSRIEKAKSVIKKKRTKEGIDIDLLIETIINKLGNNTLSNFYLQKVLNQSLLKEIILPKFDKEVKIEKHLGDIYFVFSGKDSVKCSSEIEARYIKIWVEARLEKIKIPTDNKYLAKITSQLENLYNKICSILDTYISSIVDRKIQEKFIYGFWLEVTKLNKKNL